MTKHNKSSKFTNKNPLQNNAHKHKFNPNYYPSVARVDSSLIESTCIYPETTHNLDFKQHTIKTYNNEELIIINQ